MNTYVICWNVSPSTSEAGYRILSMDDWDALKGTGNYHFVKEIELPEINADAEIESAKLARIATLKAELEALQQ